MSVLQFHPFSSALDGGFWHKLTQLKLDVFGLDDEEKCLQGVYTNSNREGLPCMLSLDFSSFEENIAIPISNFPARGLIKNTNTLDEFRNLDKKELLDSCASKLWNCITSGDAIKDPSLLVPFYLLAYGDLKKYNFYYWFSFPALHSDDNILIEGEPQNLENRFTSKQIDSILNQYDDICKPINLGFFLISEENELLTVAKLEDYDLYENKTIILAFSDPSNLPKNPGWPLRNFLCLVKYHWAHQKNTFEVLCFRDIYLNGVRKVNHSIILKIKLNSVSHLDKSIMPKCVGWERNEKQKLGPRFVNLSNSMDPNRLAESAVDLNLKLMRWRLLPDLDLDKIRDVKCLLFGAGTLGCNVARNLLAWGVRTITFIDNGRVSYSNPSRQTLFTFKDSISGSSSKSKAAANALIEIFPGVKSEGFDMSVPMPGHHVSEVDLEQVKQDCILLDKLIDEHDVLFLLMDTRESRWLPTVIGACKKKIVMCSALGFDSLLVMRHGMKDGIGIETPDNTLTKLMSSNTVAGDELGCYYCNDIVAPGDSTKDRTLDQQCTVSRPGMSFMASGLVVELMISVLQHPLEGMASAYINQLEDVHFDSPLGLVPHQIRTFLSRYQLMLPTCRAYEKCTACSNVVLDSYKEKGFDFLMKVFNNPSHLEDITGLTKLHQETITDDVWEYDDNDSLCSINLSQ